MPSRRTLAFHEAGHAVVARLLNAQVNFVAMFAADESSKSVVQTRSAAYYASADPKEQIVGLEKDTKIKLAGSIAQQIARRGKTGHGDDLSHAKNFALLIALLKAGKELPPPSAKVTLTIDNSILDRAEAILKALHEETYALLAEKWSAVERVAQKLMIRNLLGQDELDDLINDRSTEDRKFRI
jgi:ATP-dependent Zn protease